MPEKYFFSKKTDQYIWVEELLFTDIILLVYAKGYNIKALKVIFNGEKLYSIKTYGTDKEMLCCDRCDLINVTDNWIFYCNKSENNSLYKI